MLWSCWQPFRHSIRQRRGFAQARRGSDRARTRTRSDRRLSPVRCSSTCSARYGNSSTASCGETTATSTSSAAAPREAHLPQREPVDVAIEGVVCVVRQVSRKASVSKSSESDSIHRKRAGRTSPVAIKAARPPMAHQNLMGRDRAAPEAPPSSPAAGWQLDLAHHDVDDLVPHVVLVRHVVVERHRLDAELLADLAHRERVDSIVVGEADGGAQDALPAQGTRGLVRVLPRPATCDSFRA